MGRKNKIQTKSERYASNLRIQHTASEREMCRWFDTHGISYVFQSNMFDEESGRVYIADFRIKRCPPKRPKGMSRKEWHRDNGRLFVELDGSSHIGREFYDAQRTRWMEAHRNAVVLRFTNEDVWKRPEFIIAKVMEYGPAIKTKRISWTSPFWSKGVLRDV